MNVWSMCCLLYFRWCVSRKQNSANRQRMKMNHLVYRSFNIEMSLGHNEHSNANTRTMTIKLEPEPLLIIYHFQTGSISRFISNPTKVWAEKTAEEFIKHAMKQNFVHSVLANILKIFFGFTVKTSSVTWGFFYTFIQKRENFFFYFFFYFTYNNTGI